jgi:hypothetical protein
VSAMTTARRLIRLGLLPTSALKIRAAPSRAPMFGDGACAKLEVPL